MKLLTKTSRVYIVISAAIFIIGTVVFYYGFRFIVNHKTDENLFAVRDKIRQSIAEHDTVPTFFSTKADIFEVKALPLTTPQYERVRDVLIANKLENGELEPYRQLVFTTMILTKTLGKKEQLIEINISQSTIETEDLISTTAALAIGLLSILLIAMFFINRFISQKIWSPFEDTLLKIKHLQLSETDELSFKITDIDEFIALNQQLSKMTDRLRLDFQTLKEFTENASHELQTPLAALQNRLELLLQYPSLSSNALSSIADALRQTKRLSRLAQTLLLMTKIDNQQFSETKMVDLKSLILDKIDLFEPIIEDTNIKIETNFSHALTLKINPVLADILISNLLSNAIRHNIKNGNINIQLLDNQLIIENTGITAALNDTLIFKRFKKTGNTEGVGLGLSLAEQICKNYGFNIQYAFEIGIHRFLIKF